MHRFRTLRSRLLSWFLGAILIAMLTSSLVALTVRPEPLNGAEAMAHNLGAHLAAGWDDTKETTAFVNEVRDVTGFDAVLERNPRRLPPRVRRVADRGGSIAPDGPQHYFIPVVRDGALVGALEMVRFGSRDMGWGWWRLALAVVLVVAVLSALAGAVADQLARPLERLAVAADRFGGGDLTVRTDVAGGGRRWVAREVRDVAVRFNRMAERVEVMVRGQRELLGAISHELRSPLGRARVALEIARDRLALGGEPGATAEALDSLETQLGAVDAILGDLLDVTRAGLADLRKETRVFAPWLRARIAEEPSPPVIDLQVVPALHDQRLAFDPALLARVLHNLLRNARVHGHASDRPIEVRVELQGDLRAEAHRGEAPSIRVVVRDRGPGFPSGFGEKAFEPFVRGDAARARPLEGTGHGLGLTIVKRIVEAHGGRVFARNVAGGGGAEEGGGAGAEVGFDLPVTSTSR